MKAKFERQDPAAPLSRRVGGLPEDLLARRRGERLNFLRTLQDGAFREGLERQSDELFRTLLALAVNDYGVSRKALALALNIAEPTISRWAKGGSSPPAYGRITVIDALAALMVSSLGEEVPIPDREEAGLEEDRGDSASVERTA